MYLSQHYRINGAPCLLALSPLAVMRKSDENSFFLVCYSIFIQQTLFNSNTNVDTSEITTSSVLGP